MLRRSLVKKQVFAAARREARRFLVHAAGCAECRSTLTELDIRYGLARAKRQRARIPRSFRQLAI